MKTFEKYNKALEFFNSEDIPHAKALVLEVETELQTISDQVLHIQIQSNLGGLMIDLGKYTHDKELISRGKNYVEELVSQNSEDRILVAEHYNLANGYLALWDLGSGEHFKKGEIGETFSRAKKNYRTALDIAKDSKDSIDPQLLAQINTNLGNCLRDVGRFVEAFYYYDEALKINKFRGEAIGNKAITLRYLSPLAYGHRHLFLLESHRLLKESLNTSMPDDLRRAFQKEYDKLTSLIQQHHKITPETYKNSKAKSKFHQFSRDFCIRNQLYLTPATFVGKKNDVVHGDPMFISTIIVPLNDDTTINRYITFLNQIKQDFVLARYFLIQSHYRSTVVETIDRDVILYDPLDYSIHNTYIQFLKMSLKLTVDTFDKIAQFLREYCNVPIDPKTETNFRNIWIKEKGKILLRPEFLQKQNKFLFALFDLSLDLQKGGYFEKIYDRRNAITHRFLVVHEMMTPDDQTVVSSRISKDDLVDVSITAMKMLRAAVMYLIVFVDTEERKKKDSNKMYLPLSSNRISEKNQWRPYDGERN